MTKDFMQIRSPNDNMRRQKASYRHFIPGLNFSIEKHTEKVPDDGRYYLVKEDHVVEGFRSLKKADERFGQLVKQSGFTPEATQTRPHNSVEEGIERYLDAKDLYWAESYKYKQRGGKGGRGVTLVNGGKRFG